MLASNLPEASRPEPARVPQRRATEAPGHEAPARNFGYRGVIHGLRSVAATDGMLGLWRGLLPRLVLKSVGSSL